MLFLHLCCPLEGSIVSVKFFFNVTLTLNGKFNLNIYFSQHRIAQRRTSPTTKTSTSSATTTTPTTTTTTGKGATWASARQTPAATCSCTSTGLRSSARPTSSPAWTSSRRRRKRWGGSTTGSSRPRLEAPTTGWRRSLMRTGTNVMKAERKRWKPWKPGSSNSRDHPDALSAR